MSALNESLDQVKRRIRSEYLGVACIHGVGLSRKENAICIYTHRGQGSLSDAMLQEIESKARPFEVIIVDEDAPMVSGDEG